VSPDYLVLRPRLAVEARFLHYTFRSDWFVSEMISRLRGIGSTDQGNVRTPRINAQDLLDIGIAIPDLDQQRRIADFLDDQVTRIDKIIAIRQRQRELIDEQFAAVLRQLIYVSDLDAAATPSRSLLKETAALRYVARIQRGASPRPIDDPKYFDPAGSHGWVRISDVTSSGKYLEKTEQRLSPLGVSLSVPLGVGELILSISASVGKPAITKIPCCIHDGFLAIREPLVERDYLYYMFLLGDCFAGLGKLGTQLNLNSDTVGDLAIPVHSRQRQLAIVRAAEMEMAASTAAISLFRQQARGLDELKRSLITAAVTGEFDVSSADGSRVPA
jgi:type I restriction enzyme S subunit